MPHRTDLPEGLTPQDVDPARRGREPETAYRQEELARKASEEQNKLERERAERLANIGTSKDQLDKGDIGAGEDKSHGGVAISVVTDAQKAGESEAAKVSDAEASRAVGNVGSTHIEREPGEPDAEPREGKPATTRRDRKAKDEG